MKNTILTLFLLVSISGTAQNDSHYKKIYAYDEYHKDWALVKSITNNYGFIDRNGKEIVPPVYSKIYQFEVKKNKKYAMVRNVANAYGFIDENGKEVVIAISWKKEEVYQNLDLYIKKQAL